MELRTDGVPTRRVLGGDDGAPLDGDRVLAVALRWADRPLNIDHVKVGEARTPLEGVEVRWEGAMPIVATSSRVKAWVERAPGQWVDPGRRTALEPGETLIIQSGELTLEARIQRRSEKAPALNRQEGVFFGLVMAHSMMLFVAVTVAMVITPRTEGGESMWGVPSPLKRSVTPFASLPPRQPQVLEERVKEVLKDAAFRAVMSTPSQKRSAMDAMRLIAGGGGLGAFLSRGSSAIDSALQNLSAPSLEGNGGAGISARDLGGGSSGNDLGIGSIGPGVGPGAGPGKRPDGLRGHANVDIVCKDCTTQVAPGYDRSLVLKVVKRHQNEIRYCYESELNKAPNLAGKVTVAWTIGATGSVETAQIAESGLDNERVESCIVERVRRWTFPEPAGGQEVAITFPWVFSVAASEE